MQIKWRERYQQQRTKGTDKGVNTAAVGWGEGDTEGEGGVRLKYEQPRTEVWP